MPKITVDYCSKYSSFDGTPVTDGKVLAPVLISDAEFQSNNTIIPENLRTWKHYGVPFRVGFMVVDEADFNKMLSLYYSGINDYFEEHPELRPGRCVLGWDNEGFPILCSKENRCKGCPRRAEHLPRFKSREDFIQFTSFQDTHEDEDGNTVGLDIADPNVNVEEEAILETLFTELVEYLGKISPRYAKIVTRSEAVPWLSGNQRSERTDEEVPRTVKRTNGAVGSVPIAPLFYLLTGLRPLSWNRSWLLILFTACRRLVALPC